MVVIDEKPAPPPYNPRSNFGPPPFAHPRARATLTSLPAHLMLEIVHSVCPPHLSELEHCQALRWLAMSLRLVSRGMYIACMHVLRSSYLPQYAANVKPGYSSDPFPLSTPSPLPATASSLQTVQRETAVLDLFLLLKVQEDVRLGESDLHLGSDSFKDIFELMQPRARIEDLIRTYGLQQSIVTLQPTSSRFVPFQSISVSFSTRKVGLIVADSKGRKRTLTEVERLTRDETLEITAKKLVKELGKILRRARGG